MSLIDIYHKMMDSHRELISYLFFGVLTTVVSWITYALFVWIGIDINISNILSWVCGVTFAFVVNKWFVFMSRQLTAEVVLRELGSFYAARIFTGVVAFILFPVFYNIGLDQSLLGTDGFLAKIVTSIVEIILNWIFSKYLIFIKKDGE